MLQKLPAHGFKWVENTSQFNKDLKKKKKKNNEDSDKVCFLVVDGQYPEILHDFHKDLPLNSKTLRKL